jgi:hypothetical protein
LQNDLLKLAIGFEDLLKIRFGHTEVNVADVETMERSAVGTRSCAALRRSSSAILLGLCELGDDGNTFKLLTG